MESAEALKHNVVAQRSYPFYPEMKGNPRPQTMPLFLTPCFVHVYCYMCWRDVVINPSPHLNEEEAAFAVFAQCTRYSGKGLLIEADMDAIASLTKYSNDGMAGSADLLGQMKNFFHKDVQIYVGVLDEKSCPVPRRLMDPA